MTPLASHLQGKYTGVDCQGVPPYTNAMKEVAKNVYVAGTIAANLLGDPTTWLKDRDDFRVRYVGGIHNLSTNDKKKWSREERAPLRLVESGTGREEIWYPPEWKSPTYISLDAEGKLTSHVKYDRHQPTLVQDVRQDSLKQPGAAAMVEFNVWYQDGAIHREPDKPDDVPAAPAILSSKLVLRTYDEEYIQGITISLFREFWKAGQWEDTAFEDMTLVFANEKLNTPEMQKKAIEWIAKHCQGGFFPFDDPMFGDPEEEFLFLADVCQRG